MDAENFPKASELTAAALRAMPSGSKVIGPWGGPYTKRAGQFMYDWVSVMNDCHMSEQLTSLKEVEKPNSGCNEPDQLPIASMDDTAPEVDDTNQCEGCGAEVVRDAFDGWGSRYACGSVCAFFEGYGLLWEYSAQCF